jgi:hypothetical protein
MMLAEGSGWVIALVFVVFVALIVVGGIYGAKAAKARRAALASLAGELGMSFTPDDRPGAAAPLLQFGVFNLGDRRNSYNTFTGELIVNGRAVPVTFGDYRYTVTTGSGKNRRTTTHHISYLNALIAYPATAHLAVRREHWGDKIAGAIGFDDIDFESAEFSKAFHVKCDDRKFAYDLFEPRLIEWYQTSDAPPLQLAGQNLLILKGSTWSADEFRKHLDWLNHFLERWPAHLIDRLDSSLKA